MSAGYSPRSTGSRKSRFRLPSARRAAATSSSWALAGRIGWRLRPIPTRPPGTAARMACTASPWESSRWGVAAVASPTSRGVAGGVPDRDPAAVGGNGPLDLVGGCLRPQQEALGEAAGMVVGRQGANLLARKGGRGIVLRGRRPVAGRAGHGAARGCVLL